MKAAERQKLKHDKYADAVVTSLQWAKEHQSTVIAIAAAAAIVAGVILWIAYSHNQSRREARERFSEYQKDATDALALKDETRLETVKEVLAHLDGLVKTYPDSEVAPQALLQAAELLTATQQPVKAAGYYERLVEMSGAPEGIKMLARRGWAAALEESGDVEKALAQYKDLASLMESRRSQKDNASLEEVEAYWDIGRCYESLKDPDNAKIFYQKARDLGSESKWAELARFRLESLARGPLPPESVAPAPATTAAAPAVTISAPAVTAEMPPATMSHPASTTSTPSSTSSTPAPPAPPAAGETAPK